MPSRVSILAMSCVPTMSTSSMTNESPANLARQSIIIDDETAQPDVGVATFAGRLVKRRQRRQRRCDRHTLNIPVQSVRPSSAHSRSLDARDERDLRSDECRPLVRLVGYRPLRDFAAVDAVQRTWIRARRRTRVVGGTDGEGVRGPDEGQLEPKGRTGAHLRGDTEATTAELDDLPDERESEAAACASG
jgi:hypothetical protein